MNSLIYQGLLFLFILLLLAVPLGWYIKEIMQGEIPKGVYFLQPVERLFYKAIGPISKKEMSAKRYALNVLLLSFFSIVLLLVILMTQHFFTGRFLSKKSNATVSDKYGRQFCYEYQLASICG